MRDLASLLQGNPQLVGELAQMLAGMGTGKDTMLAHITPEEAQLLDQVTNGGSINPNTGLPSFDPGDYADSYSNDSYSGPGGGPGGGPSGGPDETEANMRDAYAQDQNYDYRGGSPDETEANMYAQWQRDQDINQGPTDKGWFSNFQASPSKFLGDWAYRNAGTLGAIGGGLALGPLGAFAGSLVGDLATGKGAADAGLGALGGLAGGALGAGAGLGITGGIMGSAGGAKAGQAMDVASARGAMGTQSMGAGAAGMDDPWAFGGGGYDQFGRRIG